MEIESSLNLKYIAKNIWLKPETVFRQIKAEGYSKYAYHLFFWAGFLSSVSDALQEDHSSPLTFMTFVVLIPILSGGLSIVFAYLIYLLMAAIGKKLGGQCNGDTLFKSLSYAQIPGVVLSLGGILYAVFGFRDDSPLYVLIPAGIVLVTFAVWNLIIFLVGLATMQGYSLGRAIATFLLTILVLVLIVLVPVMLFVGLGAMF